MVLGTNKDKHYVLIAIVTMLIIYLLFSNSEFPFGINY